MSALKTLTSIALVSGLIVVSNPAAAHAYGETTVATNTVVTGDGCVDHPVTYSINLPAGAKNWSFTVDFFNEQGEEGVGMIMAESLGDVPSGTKTHQICSHEGLGTWTMVPTMESYQDAAGKWVFGPLQGTPSTFEVVGKATSKLGIKGSKRGPKAKVKAKLTMTSGNDSTPVADQKVIFQRKIGRRFKKVAVGKTNAKGLATASFKARGRVSVRAIFKGAGEVVVGNIGLPLPKAKSRTITLR